MAKINRRVAALMLLAALDYSEGNRVSAGRHLRTASEDPDFTETVEGLQDQVDETADPFTDDNSDLDDLDLDMGSDDGLDEELQASLARDAKRRAASRRRRRATAGDDDAAKIGGNEGPAGADRRNDSDEEIRQEVARLNRVRQNLSLLARKR